MANFLIVGKYPYKLKPPGYDVCGHDYCAHDSNAYNDKVVTERFIDWMTDCLHD